MNLRNGTQSIIERSRNFVAAFLGTVPSARIAIRKPLAVGYILLTAHRAQIMFGILLLFLTLLAPSIVDFVTDSLFPPETSKKLLGLIKKRHVNPLKDYYYVAIMTAFWLTSIMSTLLLIWFHIPHGLARANAHAQRLLAAGDSHSDVIKSRTLYKRASAIATSPDLVSEIDARLREEALSFASSSHREATKVDSCQDDTICRDTQVHTSRSASRGEMSPSQTGLDGRYTLGPELGRGAMGVVFRAWDNVLDRRVAVKQLSLVSSGDDEYACRFRREAKALARLTHPNIVQVYDLIEDSNRLWMVLEFVDGGDLASYLRDKNRLSISGAAHIAIPVAEGLAYAHGQGVVHRDLKPANILLTSEFDPKISDFGIAKLSQSSMLTHVGSVLGSPRYMSPEQCSGSSVDARTDIYSLGITLYELISGKVPFEGDTSSVLARHIVEQPLPLSNVIESIPPEVEGLVSRMLVKSPDERLSDLTEVIETLSVFGDKEWSSSRPQRGQTTV